MAQLRQDYPQFVQRETAVIAVGPDSQQDFIKFWDHNQIPFIGLADPEHVVAKLYDQEVTLLKFGRVPAQMIIDKTAWCVTCITPDPWRISRKTRTSSSCWIRSTARKEN
jgi:peroxiredoxin